MRVPRALWLLLLFLRPPGTAYSQASVDYSSITPAQWRADLRQLADQMPRVHGNLFHSTTRSEFNAAVDNLDRQLERLNTDETLVGLARIAAMARDGHSGYLWPLLYKSPRNYPIKLVWYPDGIYVERAQSEHAGIVGGRLVEIGGVPVSEAYRRVAEITPHDPGNDARIHVMGVPLYLTQPRVLHGLHLAASAREATYVVEVGGKRLTVTLAPAVTARSVSDRAFLKPDSTWVDVRDHAANTIPLYLAHADRQYWFQYIPKYRALYVQFNETLPEGDESIPQFFDRVFDFAEHHDVRKFILDIRNNDGGDNGYLRPIVTGILGLRKINQQGRVFAIIGEETYSAAQNLTNRLELYTETTFVGQPTGNNVNFWADDQRIVLPNSKLSIGMSQLWWQDEDPRDRRVATAPEVAIPRSLQDFANNRDLAMECILQDRALPLEETLVRASHRNPDRLLAAYRQWATDPLHRYAVPGAQKRIDILGKRLIEKKRQPEGIAMLKLNTTLHPDDMDARNALKQLSSAPDSTPQSGPHPSKR